jgi:sulfite exporter TauE/SafE
MHEKTSYVVNGAVLAIVGAVLENIFEATVLKGFCCIVCVVGVALISLGLSNGPNDI